MQCTRMSSGNKDIIVLLYFVLYQKAGLQWHVVEHSRKVLVSGGHIPVLETPYTVLCDPEEDNPVPEMTHAPEKQILVNQTIYVVCTPVDQMMIHAVRDPEKHSPVDAMIHAVHVAAVGKENVRQDK